MKTKWILTAALSVGLLGAMGCKAASAGTSSAPTLTFAQATNASLQAAHKFGMDIAAAVQDRNLIMTPAEKQAFDAFAVSLNATDALFVAYENGSATQTQVSNSLSATTALQTSAQTALGAQ